MPTRPTLFARTLRFTAHTILATTVWLLTAYTVLSISPAANPPPTWTAANGKPVPPGFLFIMFPATDTVPLYDQPDGNNVGLLARAVANSRQELERNGQNGWIEVRSAGSRSTRWVQLTNLRFEQPRDSKVDYFDAYAKAVPSLDQNEFATVALHTKANGDGSQTFTLNLHPDDDYVEQYVYRLRVGTPEPLEMYAHFGPGLVFSNILWILGAVVAASLAAVAALPLARRYFKRRKPAT